MNRFKLIYQNNHFFQKSVVTLFFAGYLIIGLSIYKDYGISWDEIFSLDNGIISYNYIFNGDQSLMRHRDRDYGVAFELVLVAAQKLLKFEDSRKIFLLRHLCTFLLFYISVCFFYLLNKHYFNKWDIALLACLFLIISPRIFAHSFYNSKDIAFLAVFIISIFSMIHFLNKGSPLTIVLHSLSCAFLVDIRILGIFVPFLTIFFFILSTLTSSDKSLLKNISRIISYVLLTLLLTVLLWPYLWTDPLANFISAFVNMKKFRWDAPVLYLGQMVRASELPWHYIPVWMIVSIPILHVVFFFLGIFKSIHILLHQKSDKNRRFIRDTQIFLLWFFTPIIVVIALDSIVYDSWRHLFFLYPAFIIISINGLLFVLQMKDHAVSNWVIPLVQKILILIVVIGLFEPLYFMVRYHPYQNIYFNALAGTDMAEIKKKFELDYWGLSYRKALEYILENDPSNNVRIKVAEDPGYFNSYILPEESRHRLIYVNDLKSAKYFISTFRWHPSEYSPAKDFFSIKIGAAKIIVVYRLKI